MRRTKKICSDGCRHFSERDIQSLSLEMKSPVAGQGSCPECKTHHPLRWRRESGAVGRTAGGDDELPQTGPSTREVVADTVTYSLRAREVSGAVAIADPLGRRMDLKSNPLRKISGPGAQCAGA
jgi:hypothetical protein